jgi:hypothetical protein
LKNITVFIIATLLGTALLRAQTDSVSLHYIPNYDQWGWNSVVMQNEFITVAAVPAIGGRIMKYDLGNIPSVYINTSELGKTYTPAQNGYHNFGGYKTWPSPQYRWPGTWPPPPTLDYGNYSFETDSLMEDSVSVIVASPVEEWICPGIRFERKATIYPRSTRVKMDQTIINEGAISANWGMWSITQSIVNHSGQTDYENFWAYFPLNASSIYGASGIMTDGSSNAWKGEIAPGIYGVQFYPTPPYGKKVFADPNKGWLAYSVVSDTVVFAKTFDVYEGSHYPDSARVTVYVSNTPAYMEIEVKFPLIDIGPGERYTYAENWWTAKVRAPILDVNPIGAIAQRLSYDSTMHTLSAIYGVFHKGNAKVVFKDEAGSVLSEVQQYSVSPFMEVRLDDTLSVPENTKRIEFQVFNPEGDLIGILDSADIEQILTSVGTKAHTDPLKYNLNDNYPNPFNPSTTIKFELPVKSRIKLAIYDPLGRKVEELVNGVLEAGTHTRLWTADVSSGVYFCRMEAVPLHDNSAPVILTRKMLLLR